MISPSWKTSCNHFLPFCLGLALAWASIVGAQSVHPSPEDATPPQLPDWQPPRLVLLAPAGTPVRLDMVNIDAEIHGTQALTRIELGFFNPNSRVLEGELQFPLLNSQQVIGLAMDLDGQLREAVPVEKGKGRQVFEEVIRQRIDPALLEQTPGNNYKLRVYPIPANGAKRVVFRILETLPLKDGHMSYRLPLAYADRLPSLDLNLKVFGDEKPLALSNGPGPLVLARRGEVYQTQLTREHYEGKGWVELRVPAAVKPGISSQRRDGKTWFRAEIPTPAATLQPRPLPDTVLLLWDASGSGAKHRHARALDLLDAYFQSMGNGNVLLVRLRDRPEASQGFRVERGKWRELRKALESTAYDGATRFDLPEGLGATDEALLVSDGLINYGDEPMPELGMPLFSISTTPGADGALLRLMAERSGGRYIDLTRLSNTEAIKHLTEQPVELGSLSGQGVSDLVSESMFATDGRFLVAGIADSSRSQLVVNLKLPDGKHQHLELNIPEPGESSLAALTWARLTLAQLDAERDLHRGKIRRLGRQFGLPTAETSLIVLDRVEDYAAYRIEPPPELKDDYERLLAGVDRQQAAEQSAHLEQVVQLFQAKQQWWERDFPKDTPPKPEEPKKERRGFGAIVGDMLRSLSRPEPAMEREAVMAAPAPAPAPMAEAASATTADTGGNDPAISIKLKKWTSDAPYIRRFQEADTDKLYAIYLDERPDWTASSAFYLDAADEFFERKQLNLALRVLSNLAEMELENRHLLRILAYRLIQAGQPGLAIPVLRKVQDLAPDEPQSWRDLGLAQAAAGQVQKALNNLYGVVERPWHERFPEIELITLAELNALIANADKPLDTARIDPRLLQNLPLDLRVVLTWDADNSDMDLWVTDPNGEKSFYGNKLSYQGGRMSPDFTRGYGPEEFSLKRAKPGKYLVQANFYGHSQQVVAGATTLQLDLFTGFGSLKQKHQAITLRLSGPKEVVTVGEFTVD